MPGLDLVPPFVSLATCPWILFWYQSVVVVIGGLFSCTESVGSLGAEHCL